MINGKKGYEIRMSKKVKQRSPEERKKLFEKFDRTQLELIIEAYEEHIENLEHEKAEQEKIKSKCSLYRIIDTKFNVYKYRSNKTQICEIINLSRRTYNHRKLHNSDYSFRKIRKDSIIDSPYIASLIHTIFEKNKSTYGHNRIHKCISIYGINCSKKTINNAMNKYRLFPAERYSKKRIYELKSTSEQKTYLLTNELIKTYKPNEVYAIDFSQIKTSSGIM